MRAPELHITVVAFTGGPGLEMTEELALVKAALLYADRVTLASPKTVMFASMASYLVASPADRRTVLMEIAAALPEGRAGAEMLQALRRKKHRSGPEIIALKRLEKQLEASAVKFEQSIASMLEKAKASELDAAMQAGVLDIDALGVNSETGSYSSEAMTRAVAALIEEVLGAQSSTYPMFSEMLGGLARAMVKEGKIAGAELAPATQAGVAGRFISAIEAFPHAPMDVVLDAREKLREPLTAFRAGIIGLSAELDREEITALDPRFERASADLYRRHVAPALLELGELSKEMRLLPALARSAPGVAKDIALSAAPLLTLAATSDAGFTGLAAIAAAGKAGMTAADLLGRAATRQRDAREEAGKNQYVWLYEAAPLLKTQR